MVLLACVPAAEPGGWVPAAAWAGTAATPAGMVAELGARIAAAGPSGAVYPRNPGFIRLDPDAWEVTRLPDTARAPAEPAEPAPLSDAELARVIGAHVPPGYGRALRAAAAAGRPLDPSAPAGMDPAAAARWVTGWALTIQAPLLAGLADPVFTGRPGGTVTFASSTGGDPIALLANTGLSPGFAWGPGSGAAGRALAKSLLTAALGRAAACPACHGHGTAPGDLGCMGCLSTGLRVTAAAAQAFQRDMVEAWPDGEGWGWEIRRSAIRAWLTVQDADTALAAAARDLP